MGVKIEIHKIHEIHQNLRNPVYIIRNPPCAQGLLKVWRSWYSLYSVPALL